MANDRDTTGFEWGERRKIAGMPYRATGDGARAVVLVHGLGVSSRIFALLARALVARGAHVLSPDLLPGAGPDPLAQAAGLAAWADALAVKDAVWIGHSAGSLALERLAASRPDLVAEAFYVGPPWGRRTLAQQAGALFSMLFDLDADERKLIGEEYGHVGFMPFFRHAWNASRLSQEPPVDLRGTVLAGERDPIVDRAWLATLPPTRVIRIPGGHANIADRAEAVASAIAQRTENR